MALRKALAWSVSGQFLSFAVNFVGTVIIARILTPYDMGVFALAVAIIATLNILTTFGIGTYVVRETELKASTLNSAFTLNAILAIAMAAIIGLASIVERIVFNNTAVAQVLMPLAASPIIGIFEFRPAVMLQREMNFRMLSLINIGRGIVSAAAVIGLALNGFTYMSFAYSSLLAGLFGAACVNLVAGKHAGFRLSFSEGRKMALFGLQMLTIGGVNTIAMRLSDIILGNILGLTALGLYSRASTISFQIFDNIYGAVTRVLFVKLSEDFRERGVLRDVFIRGLEMITALIWPLIIGLAVLSGPAIYILYGERWVGAALPLSLLLIAQFIVICYGMNWELFVLKEQTAKQARFESIRAIGGVVIFSIGCLFSIATAALGRVAEALLGLALYSPHMSRMAGTAPGEIMRVYARGSALTIAAALPSFILMVTTDWSYKTSPVLIAAAIAVGIVLWLAVLIRQRHPLVDELRRVGRQVPVWGSKQ